jgi:hypothetical protein
MRSTSESQIVDFYDKCLRSEFLESKSSSGKRSRTNSDQYSEGQLSTQADLQPGNQTMKPFKSSATKSFTCKGNDLLPFMPLQTYQKELFRSCSNSEFCYEIYRMQEKQEASWMQMFIVWPPAGGEEMKCKNHEFKHKTQTFAKYVWDIHSYSVSIRVQEMKGMNVIDCSHMRVTDDEYYNFPKVNPEEFKKFYRKNGIYDKTYKSLIY